MHCIYLNMRVWVFLGRGWCENHPSQSFTEICVQTHANEHIGKQQQEVQQGHTTVESSQSWPSWSFWASPTRYVWPWALSQNTGTMPSDVTFVIVCHEVKSHTHMDKQRSMIGERAFWTSQLDSRFLIELTISSTGANIYTDRHPAPNFTQRQT